MHEGTCNRYTSVLLMSQNKTFPILVKDNATVCFSLFFFFFALTAFFSVSNFKNGSPCSLTHAPILLHIRVNIFFGILEESLVFILYRFDFYIPFELLNMYLFLYIKEKEWNQYFLNWLPLAKLLNKLNSLTFRKIACWFLEQMIWDSKKFFSKIIRNLRTITKLLQISINTSSKWTLKHCSILETKFGGGCIIIYCGFIYLLAIESYYRIIVCWDSRRNWTGSQYQLRPKVIMSL